MNLGDLKRDLGELGELKRTLDFMETSTKPRRMELPMFDGTDPSVWLSKAERFFSRSKDDAKLDLVFLCLEGAALKWFLRRLFTDWSDFEHRLLARFDHTVTNCSPTEVFLGADDLIGATEVTHPISKLKSEAKESNMETDGVAGPKVSISQLEPSLTFRNESLDDLLETDSLGVDDLIDPSSKIHAVKSFSAHKTIATEPLIHEAGKLDYDAYKVFDIMPIRSHLVQSRKKLCLSPKSWMFKFKTRLETRVLIAEQWLYRVETINNDLTSEQLLESDIARQWISTCHKLQSHDTHMLDSVFLQRQKMQKKKQKRTTSKYWMFKFKKRSMTRALVQAKKIQPLLAGVYKDPIQVEHTLVSIQFSHHKLADKLVSNWGSNIEAAEMVLVRMNRRFQRLKLEKKAHMSRVLCNLRMLHDPGGMKQILHSDMKPMFFSKKELGESCRDIDVKARIRVGLDEIELQLLQDVQDPLITVFGNGETATGFGKEMLVFHQSFPGCLWSGLRLDYWAELRIGLHNYEGRSLFPLLKNKLRNVNIVVAEMPLNQNTSSMLQVQLQHTQKKRKCHKTWMFKYKPQTQQKEWTTSSNTLYKEPLYLILVKQLESNGEIMNGWVHMHIVKLPARLAAFNTVSFFLKLEDKLV